MPATTPPDPPPDPQALIRSRSYVQLLVLAALVGLPVSAASYGFLALVDWLQGALFDDLPTTLGFDAPPTWWPLPLLAVGGLLAALAIRMLPGTGGHSPADGFHTSGPLPPIQLPGVFLAALATLAFGAVLGPEAPLILAFLLLEASGLGGPMLGLVLLPGLLAAGLGTLIFLGLDSITGLGTFSLAIPGLPPFDHLTVADFGYALAFGLIAPFLGRGITLLALWVRARVEPRMILLMPVLGLAIAGLAIGFGQATDKPA